jgi:anti-sigma factor RsiW
VSRLPDNQSCEQVQQDLETYLDGGLSTVRVHQVEGHLSDCPTCLAQVHLAKEIQNELRALPEFDAPAPVIQSIFDQTVRSENRKRSVGDFLGAWPRPVWATLAAASLVLVFTLAVLNQSATPPDQPNEAAVAQATAEARFALAKVGLATRKAGVTVRDKALRDQIAVPTRKGLSRAFGRDGDQESGSLNKGVNDV